MKNLYETSLMKTVKEPILFYEEGVCSLDALITLVALGKPFYTCRLGDGDDENSEFKKLNAWAKFRVSSRTGSS